MFKRAIAGTAAFLFLSGLAHAQLSETEQRIVAAVKQRTPAALELLEKSVRINSGTLNPEGVRAVGEIYRAELDALGFKTRWIEMPPAMKRAGHLAAVHVFMPGTRLERAGDARHCQGTVLADWIARRGDGGELGRGTNVFQLDADGRIADVVGIWAPGAR